MLGSALAFLLAATAPGGSAPDAVRDGLSTISLEQAIRHARERAPQAAVAQAQILLGEAEQRATQPLLPANPSLYVGAGGRMNLHGASVEMQAQVSQPIEIAGERRLRRSAANAELEARQAAHASAQWIAEVQARTAFFRAVLARRRAETAETAEAFSKEVVTTIRSLVDAGQESPLRLRLAEAEAAQASQAHKDAEYRYRAACNRLARQIGWEGDQPPRPRGALPPPVISGNHAPPQRHVLDDHVAARSAKARVRAAKAKARSARRDGWPHPTVGAYVATEREPGTPFRSHVGLATVTIPIPLWRRNQGSHARAEAELRVAQTQASFVQRNLARDLQRAADSVSTAGERLQTYTHDVLPRFSENLELIRKSFELGEIDVLEVFVARERFLELQTRALDVYEDYIAALRDYELAAGSSATGARTAPTGVDATSAEPIFVLKGDS